MPKAKKLEWYSLYCLVNTSSFQYQRSLRLEFGVQFQRSEKKKIIFNLCWQWEYKVMVDKLSFCLEGFSKVKTSVTTYTSFRKGVIFSTLWIDHSFWQHCVFWISDQYLNHKQQCTLHKYHDFNIKSSSKVVHIKC